MWQNGFRLLFTNFIRIMKLRKGEGKKGRKKNGVKFKNVFFFVLFVSADLHTKMHLLYIIHKIRYLRFSKLAQK